MSRDHTQLLTIAVLLVAVGIMTYGWGRSHEQASDYRDLMEQYRDTVHAMEDRYNAAQDTIDALTYRLEQRAQEQAAIQQDRRIEAGLGSWRNNSEFRGDYDQDIESIQDEKSRITPQQP